MYLHLLTTSSMIMFAISRSFRLCSSFSFEPWCQTVSYRQLICQPSPRQPSFSLQKPCRCRLLADWPGHWWIGLCGNQLVPEGGLLPQCCWFCWGLSFQTVWSRWTVARWFDSSWLPRLACLVWEERWRWRVSRSLGFAGFRGTSWGADSATVSLCCHS